MVDRSEGDLCSDLMIEILEHVIVKLLGIINGDFSWDTIVVDDLFPEKFFDGCGAYVCDRLCHDPLCEIFNCDNGESVVALSWSLLADYVNAPSLKGPGRCD
jgi:hypothetical protein